MKSSKEIARAIERISTTVPFDIDRPHIPIEVAGILNPYKNYPYFAKGQVHCHSKWSDGNIDAREVMRRYRDKGFIFVCLTDHDKQTHRTIFGWQWQTKRSCEDIFKNPDVQGIIWIPGLEPYGTNHLLWLGLTKKNPCRPGGDNSLADTILWIEQQEGIAVAAHPWSVGSHAWKDGELMNRGLRGMEIKPNAVSQWDRLLKADYVRWGFCSDDHEESNIGQGYVIVNGNQEVCGGRDIIEEMRNGNFYSIYRGSIDSQTPPIFRGIKDHFGTIFVSYDQASVVRFIGRDGLLQHSVVGTNEASYKCIGSEGYVRIELQDTHGTIAYSQPLFVYGASIESGIQVDSTQLEVRFLDMGIDKWWYLAHGSDCIWFFFNDEQGARDALSALQHYKPDRICFIGRHLGELNPLLTYFTVDGHAPVGLPPNRSYVPIDPGKLYVELASDNRWKIINPLPQERKEWLLDFEDSQIQAIRALEFIRRYNFNAICFVGNLPGNRFKYFIKV